MQLHDKSSVARGYFSDPFGASISNLPTAGACDQRVGVALSNLPTAGVCDQRVLDLLYSILETAQSMPGIKYWRMAQIPVK